MPLIQNGDSTHHHHDQVMTPISFRTTNVTSAIWKAAVLLGLRQ